MGRLRIYPDNNTRVREWRKRKREQEKLDSENLGLLSYLDKLIRKGYNISYSLERGQRQVLEVTLEKPHPQQPIRLVWDLDVVKEDQVRMELEEILNGV